MEKEQKQPEGHIFRPDTLFSLNLEQMRLIEEALAPMEYLISIKNHIKNVAAAQGAVVPFFQEDVDPITKQLINPEEFWKKNAITKSDSVILDPKGAKANKN